MSLRFTLGFISYALVLGTVGPLWAQAPADAGASNAFSATAPAAQLLQNDRSLARWVTEHSQQLAAARADFEAANSVRRGARLLPNPVVDMQVSNFALGRTTPSGLGPDRTLIYGVGLSETVELGKREPRIAAASLRARAAGDRVVSTLADRVSYARYALGRLVYAEARALQLDASLAQAEAAAEVAKGRLDHQALSGVDYDRLLIDLAGIRTESAHAHADAQAADAECAATMLARCDLADAGVALLGPSVQLPSAWSDADLARRADLKALRLERDAARRDADLASARAIPDLTFRLGYTHDAFTVSGDLGNSLALSVSAPLAVFDQGQHGKTEALAHAEQFERTAQGTFNHARGEVIGLFTRMRAIEGALATLEQDALPRANGVLEAQERGLHEGQLDITDLLLARRQAIALRLQTLELHFELFTIRNDIRQALGLDEALAQR